MKNKLSTVASILLCILLAAAAVCIGAVRGWSQERSEVLSALEADGEMYTLLENRAMDAANLCVVAARHLPEDDEQLLNLRAASSLMLSGNIAPEQLLLADQTITDTAIRFADELPQLDSVQSSKRDRAYVSMLTGALQKKTSLSYQYGLAVEDFNLRLRSELTGRLAMLLGVAPLPGVNAE
ncbi:MAG: hypothetical protein E7327_05700 [Clostridiales bacterium]|nr:hypothetical protein [Clostridiales bacterium]